MSDEIPILKEYRIQKLIKCLECIDKSQMNRDHQRDCIFKIYQNKKILTPKSFDKAVFRGMVIPSLRYLGLIIGFGESIRLSSNGKIIIESVKINNELHQRAICTIFLEMDRDVFHFLETIIQHRSLSKKEIIELLSLNVKGPSKKQNYERVKKWIALLIEAGLIVENSEKLSIDFKRYTKSLGDLNTVSMRVTDFENILFESYWKSSENNAGIVNISDLRTSVALKYLIKYNQIITESEFDNLLREVPLSSNNYIISLGRSMGAGEKLYKYKENYFKTVFIKFLKGSEN